MRQRYSHWQWAFERGRDDFKRGRARPPMPPDDGTISESSHARWYGWMLERGIQLMEQDRLRRWATGAEE